MEDSFRILKPYLRGFPLIVLVMIVSMWLANRYLRYVTPMYESTLKMRLADINENVPNSNLFKDFDVFVSTNKIATEIEVIKSQVLLNKVLDSLDFDWEIYRVGALRAVELYHESPFKIEATLSPQAHDKKFKLNILSKEKFSLTLPTQKTVKGEFGKKIVFEYGEITLHLDNEIIASKKIFDVIDKYELEYLSRHKLLGKAGKNLDVMAVDKDVAVVRINFKSPVPEKASRIANKIAEIYIMDYIESKYKSAHTTVKFLEGQINNISQKLATSENNIQGYRDTRSITNLRQETETDLRKISQLKIQQTNIKMNLDAIRDLNQYIRAGKHNFLELAPNFEAFTDLLSTEMVKKIKQLQSDKKDLLLTYTNEDERVKVVDRKLEDITSYLVESIQNTEKNLETKYKRLSDDITEAQKVFLPVPEKEKVMTSLNREFEIFQQSYIFLNEKRIEADIARAAKIAFHRIISPAYTSKEQVSPNKTIIVIVSAILGMFAMIFLIFLVHLLKGKVNDAYNIERNSAIPIASYTPMLWQKEKIAQHFLKEAIQLELKKMLMPQNIVVFSSHTAGEGRGFHILHLAHTFSLQGRQVLVIDMNEELQGKVGENVEYISFAKNDFQYMTQEKINEFLAKYKQNFDFVLVNNLPLSEAGSSLQMMSTANTNFVLLDARKTPRKYITQIDLTHQEYALPNTHFILNKAGYNPNIIKQAYRYCKKYVSNILRKNE